MINTQIINWSRYWKKKHWWWFSQFSTRKRMPYKPSVGFFGINWYKTKSQGIKWAQEKCWKDKRLTLIKLESILCFTIGLDFEACLFHSACWRVDNPLKPEQVTVIENSSRSIEGRVLETGINISIKNLPTVFESLVFRTDPEYSHGTNWLTERGQ